MTNLPYAEVIGDPIDHSLSPVIHNFWLEALGMDGRYDRLLVTRPGLPAYLEERRVDPDWRGCNITMPLKLDALTLADDAADLAVTTGAANIIVPRDGRLLAANSDVGAIAEIMVAMHEAGRSMGGVTLLGNGGAARAGLVACRMIGLTMVRIQARDMAAATKLAVEFGLDVPPAPLTEPILGGGLINATPLGLAGRDCLNCDLSAMDDDGWVLDMVTDPVETPLIVAARERGLAIATGLDMLVGQAAASFKLFFDADPPRDRDQELWHKLGQ